MSRYSYKEVSPHMASDRAPLGEVVLIVSLTIHRLPSTKSTVLGVWWDIMGKLQLWVTREAQVRA
jgi:hypothetical protein